MNRRLILMLDHEGHIAAATLLLDDEPEHDRTTGMDARTFATYLTERFTSDAPTVEVHPLHDAN